MINLANSDSQEPSTSMSAPNRRSASTINRLRCAGRAIVVLE